MIEINDVTTYLAEETPLNKAANTEIRNIIAYIIEKLEAIETTEEEDWLINLNGNPATLIDKHELDISWESDTDKFDEDIKRLIQEANQ
jgi:hypothetical protein